MSIVISFINVKGGVGKTLNCINLAGQIAFEGKKVLLIDNDSQSSLTQILNVSSKNTLYDLYSNNKVKVEDCITKFKENIYVIPNTIESAILENSLHNRMTRETILKNKFNKFNNDFDFILIDNSPFLGILAANSLSMSDYYIEIIDNSPSALQGLNLVTKVVEDIKENELNKDIKLLGILRNRFDKRSNFTKQFTEVLEETLNNNLFKTIIPDSIKYKEATVLGQLIQDYNQQYSYVYKELFNEIIQRINI